MPLNLGRAMVVELKTWDLKVQCRQCGKSVKDWRFVADKWDEKMYYNVRYYCVECHEQFKKEFM